MPKTIMSNSDMRFALAFWKSLHRSLSIRLAFNITYHPQIDEQFEKVNKRLRTY